MIRSRPARRRPLRALAQRLPRRSTSRWSRCPDRPPRCARSTSD